MQSANGFRKIMGTENTQQTMKFRSSIVAAALAVAGMQTAEAFSPAAVAQGRQTAQSPSALGMVATNEVVDTETRKKTRQVRFPGDSMSTCVVISR